MSTNTLTLISNHEMYEKERSGAKPNTLRDISIAWKAKRAEFVRIRKGYTNESFTRKITDVSTWGGHVIISWNPNEKA